MKAAIFGAGNIGRGFIGALFSQAGYEVTFIDVVPAIIERANTDHCYPLHIVSSEGTEIVNIDKISAVNAGDAEAAAEVIFNADIVATCVGAKAIKYIITNLTNGVKRRVAAGRPPLNLLICENLMDADKYIHSLLEETLTPDELAQVGLVETSVGRMVPVPKPETTADNPLRICVEQYGVLPVDRDAFKGGVPEIKNVVPFSPFHYYIERKLFIHNMGHAICAYLGGYLGHEYIWQSIADPTVRIIVREAMIESALTLAKKYGTEVQPLTDHSGDLIRRFGNKALGDTCARVGNDIPRKLALSDRLTGAGISALENGVQPVFIALGSAAALNEYVTANGIATDDASVRLALTSLTSLAPDHKLTEMTMAMYPALRDKKSLPEILAAADAAAKAAVGTIA